MEEKFSKFPNYEEKSLLIHFRKIINLGDEKKKGETIFSNHKNEVLITKKGNVKF